ncbi:twin-arginine translocation signal domain-containing protein [Vibrio sp. 99-70-13A1]|uniref:twin-arginine translocation signal domain-containing protein n=1 Tax=Vibrio sp. 99-70-13A1 TaxID=2607601 RepID=UPI0014938244|nr:twin-arginine translocation signal domain-containing protein [Vibrio sp. 99-70-13A1]NOH96327.1 twin-arginine translocation signal domain-containing protein [Vibrio sp. 99-70-13A1]
MKDQDKVNTSRRDLLKGLSTAAVAGAVVAGTAKVANASVASNQESTIEKHEEGYHETQHIRDYYDSL